MEGTRAYRSGRDKRKHQRHVIFEVRTSSGNREVLKEGGRKGQGGTAAAVKNLLSVQMRFRRNENLHIGFKSHLIQRLLRDQASGSPPSERRGCGRWRGRRGRRAGVRV